jgi:hypothetical protein
MAPSQEVLRTQLAWVAIEGGGRACVKHGEPLPNDIAAGEADYLREQGALVDSSALVTPEGDPIDAVDALVASTTEAQLTEYVRDTTIKDIVAAVGGDVELAKRVLIAEADATGGEPRPTLVKALEKVVQADTGETPPAPAEGDAPPAPADYSDWKGPQIKAELTKRGIEFKPVGVKNADLIALLVADDAKQG